MTRIHLDSGVQPEVAYNRCKQDRKDMLRNCSLRFLLVSLWISVPFLWISLVSSVPMFAGSGSHGSVFVDVKNKKKEIV